jgi:hypothetical protein
MIAYEYLEKLLSARDEKGLESWDRGSQSDIVRPSWTLSGHTGLCLGGSLGENFEIFELSWNQTKLYRYEIGHQRNQHAKYKS